MEFFTRSFARSGDPKTIEAVERACAALRAISAIGNVIVFTFTVSKVKQEIAKEGIFPYSLYLASSYEFSFRHGFRRLPEHHGDHRLHSSKTPAAALLLHWTITTILIIAAVAATARESTTGTPAENLNTQISLPGYSLLAMAYTYGLDLIWFTVIGINMLRLRLWPGSTWRAKSPVPHWLGITAAAYFTLANAFPLISLWIPDLPAHPWLARSNGQVPWYAGQLTSLAILAGAFVYWLGFRFYLRQKRKRHGVDRVVSRHPIFCPDKTVGGAGGGVQVEGGEKKLVLLYEIIRLQWVDWAPEEEEEENRTSTLSPQPVKAEDAGSSGNGVDERPHFRMPMRGC